jgi:hypothetical protein
MADNSEFDGFANAPVDEKGNRLDFRDVPSFEDSSDAGQTRVRSQTTESSIVAFRSEGPSTNGAPMASVPAAQDPEPQDVVEDDASDATAAGGEEDAAS